MGTLILAKRLVACALLASTAHATPPQTSVAHSVLPAGQSLAKVADNTYFQNGISAATEGLRTVSITIDAAPVDSLAVRANMVHLGMTSAGYSFAGQSSIEIDGRTALILLTYQR